MNPSDAELRFALKTLSSLHKWAENVGLAHLSVKQLLEHSRFLHASLWDELKLRAEAAPKQQPRYPPGA